MKPLETALFLLTVFLLLLAVSLYFPEKGLPLTSSFSLRFFPHTNLLPQEDLTASLPILDTVLVAFVPDSLMLDTVRLVDRNVPPTATWVTPIEFPDGNITLFHPLYKLLRSSRVNESVIRIMHYGDSQLEGDRITSVLRARMQERFGGYGIGLLPLVHEYDFSYAVRQSGSDNWIRETVFGKVASGKVFDRAGPLGAYFFFDTPFDKPQGKEGEGKAWIAIRKSSYSFPGTRKFDRCRIFYGYSTTPFSHEIYLNNKIFDAELFPPVNGPKEIDWRFDHPAEHIRLTFTALESPLFLCISLEPYSGVVVDNIAVRGSSGNFFTRLDPKILAPMYQMLGTNLIILQFGGNIVPHIASGYTYYENTLVRQVNHLKQAAPDAVVLLIGVADMSVNDKGIFVTYPNLEAVNQAIRNAANRSGAAYWDIFDAMGGEGSIPRWVKSSPPLASTDHVHFNPRGAALIGQLLYNALMAGYEAYEQNVEPITINP